MVDDYYTMLPFLIYSKGFAVFFAADEYISRAILHDG
jgi:hypothetical protein